MIDAKEDFGFKFSGASDAGDGDSLNSEAVLSIMQALARYRDGVRELAISKKDHSEFLKLSDRLRDEDLLDVGVVLEDRESGRSLVKLASKMAILSIREEKKRKEQEKLQRKLDTEKLQQERLMKGQVKPECMFLDDSLYSKYDEAGIPTHEVSGEEISKSRRKKFLKEFEAQAKLHQEYLKHQGPASNDQ